MSAFFLLAAFSKIFHTRYGLIVICIAIINVTLAILFVSIMNKIETNMMNKQLVEVSIPDLPVLQNTVNLELSARSYMVYAPESRTVVFEKNSKYQFLPASTTKIMTALVALEHYSLDTVLVANGVSAIEGSSMGLVEGETITVRSLLYGLMLPSGNDAAYVLASQYPGGYTAFIRAMNTKAKQLKLYNTRFVDPAGLEDQNFTTAFDLARLAAHAIDYPDLKKIVETKEITVYDTTYTHSHPLENLNRLLYTQGVFGIKTGYTDEAGQVLVTSFDSKGKTYIVVVLKSEDRFYDTEEILTKIVKNVSLIDL